MKVTVVGRLAVATAAFALSAAPAAGQKLFKSQAPVEATITTNLKDFLRERDSTKLARHNGELTYKDTAGNSVTLPVQIRARGHYRRMAKTCEFPPLWMEVKKGAPKGNLFGSAGRVKITTNCRPKNAEYEQYVLQELFLYRAYNVLTDTSLHTRLAHITYKDSAARVPDVTSWAFFIENHESLAERTGTKVLAAKGALFDDLNPDILGLVGVFEYFIANTDWSIAGQHNTLLLQDTVGRIMPVAYDFDGSGAVDARYAFPDPRFKMSSVTTRLYRGECRDEKGYAPVLARFMDKRAAIDSIFGTIPQMSPDKVKKMRSYFDEFWKLAANPKAAAREFRDGCQQKGN
jgi:hypothetical protein